jgi:hypothetical protein
MYTLLITSRMTTVKEPPNGSKSPSFFRSVVSKLKPPTAPVSSRTQHHTPSPLKSQISDLPSPENVSRCEFTFSDGRQCSNPAKVYPQDELSPVKDKKVANQRASLCAHHAPKQKRGGKGAALNAPELEALCSDLTTATNINRALAQTFLLMAQGRISRKDAVAFGYLSQLMLQTVSGVRAEYVAANGYRQWENKLKTSLTPDADDDPEPSPGGDSGPSGGGGENLEQRRNGVVERQKAAFSEKSTHRMSFSRSNESIRPLLPHREDERVIPPKPSPVNKVKRERRTSPNPPQERPLAERIMGEPDYADILSRSLDMLDRKYDFTPEGRSEAQKLALELELMKPAPAKPAKDFFGQTVDLVRRFRDAEERNGAGDLESSSLPREAFLNYYGHPIKLAVPPESGTTTPGCAHATPSPSRSQPPTAPDPQPCSSGRGETVPEAQRSCAPSASDPTDFVAPPSRRHRKHRSHSSAPGCAPPSELPLPLPISPTTAKADSVGGADNEHHEGHHTDWYAPPSWSNTRPPDPCPSRKEKLQRKIRSLTNSAFRRLQHQNSRGFSNKALQKLTP